MQITNNHQPSFKGLNYKTIFNPNVEKEVKDILYSKLPRQEVDNFLRNLEKSPVETTLGLADTKGFNRLDASVYYKHPNCGESFEYIAEKKWCNLFGIKPRNFIHRVLLSVESIEETFQVGRYAK